jgi:tetratricopeptide (TPR) repeat protein
METLKKIVAFTCFSLIITAAVAQNTSSIQAAFTKSYVSEQAGNYSAAINDLNNVYSDKDYIMNIRLGWLYYLSKKYNESIKYYEIAIALKPYAVEARFGCIKPLSAIENWEKVKDNYLKILKIDPQNTTANYWLGVIYYNKKDYANACKCFEKNVNLYPLDYNSTIMLGWSKLNAGKSADAKLMFHQSLIIRPNDASALAGLKQIK